MDVIYTFSVSNFRVLVKYVNTVAARGYRITKMYEVLVQTKRLAVILLAQICKPQTARQTLITCSHDR